MAELMTNENQEEVIDVKESRWTKIKNSPKTKKFLKIGGIIVGAVAGAALIVNAIASNGESSDDWDDDSIDGTATEVPFDSESKEA